MPERNVSTSFWEDSKIRSLSAEARCVFMYLLTAPSSHVSGIFEVHESTISCHMGFPQEVILSCLEELVASNRIMTEDGWIWIIQQSRRNIKMLNFCRSVKNAIKHAPVGMVSAFSNKYPVIIKEVERLCNDNGSPLQLHGKGLPRGLPVKDDEKSDTPVIVEKDESLIEGLPNPKSKSKSKSKSLILEQSNNIPLPTTDFHIRATVDMEADPLEISRQLDAGRRANIPGEFLRRCESIWPLAINYCSPPPWWSEIALRIIRLYAVDPTKEAFAEAEAGVRAGKRIPGIGWVERWLEGRPGSRLGESRRDRKIDGPLSVGDAVRQSMAALGRNVDGSPLAPPEKSDNEDIIV